MINPTSISDIRVGGVDFSDAPDFCEAHIESCWVGDREATEEECDEITNKFPEIVYKAVWEKIREEADFFADSMKE